jgi:hypothetical protein
LARQLYTFFRSSTSFRLRIALAYKGLDYEPHYVSLPKMQHRDPSYRDLNPQGLVPLLIDGDRSLIQSMAIIEYLDEVYPNPPLMPKDVDGRAYVRAASQIVGCEIHPLNNVRVLKPMRGMRTGSPRGCRVLKVICTARSGSANFVMATASPWPTSAWCRRFSTRAGSIARSTPIRLCWRSPIVAWHSMRSAPPSPARRPTHSESEAARTGADSSTR